MQDPVNVKLGIFTIRCCVRSQLKSLEKVRKILGSRYTNRD